jgi:hypothetical protein
MKVIYNKNNKINKRKNALSSQRNKYNTLIHKKYKLKHNNPKKSRKYTNNNHIQYGGKEYLKSNKNTFNKSIIKKKKNTSKMPAEMELKDYKQYASLVDKSVEAINNIRNPLVYEYMFSPLLTEQMKRDANSTAGSFLVATSPTKIFDQVKKIVSGKKDDTAMKNTLSSLGNWVDQSKRFDEIQIKDMGYRNDTGQVLKPEEMLSQDSSFKDVIAESKKYSGLSKVGKITPRGLLKMVRLLHKFKKNDKQWLRVSTITDIIYQYLGKNISRQRFFQSERIIPEYVMFEVEEFYNTDHLFMTQEEIEAFRKKLDFYQSKQPKIGRKVELAKPI